MHGFVMTRCLILTVWTLLLLPLLLCTTARAQEPFKLAPAVAVEAEDFKMEQGWHPIKMGEGNYAVDIIGFSHTSGERFLHVDARDTTASAYQDITVPQVGPYRLWVRYEYMPFTESRFKVTIEQNGQLVAEKLMGSKESLRTCPWSDGLHLVKQYDPPWGNEGLTEEPLDITALTAGPARIRLQTVDQPQIQGVSADRNIDLLYMTSDVKDEWRKHGPYNGWYGILFAFLDTLGARYEVQFTNQGDKPMSFSTSYAYNRLPWGASDPVTSVIDPGAISAWLPLKSQDTSHASMARFIPSVNQPFTVSVRPIGGTQPEETVKSSGDWAGIFLPPYPGKGEKAINVLKAQQNIIDAVKVSPAPGKVPTLPLCYGGYMYYTEDNQYARNYALLGAVLGMRNTGFPTGVALKNVQAAGLGPTKSANYGEYRFPPTPENIATAKAAMEKIGAMPYMRWFDYGDEIAFSEWFYYMAEQKKKELNNPKLTVDQMIRPMWLAWLIQNRKGFKPEDYWRASWGKLDATQLHPDASAEASTEKPKLYVDSVLFYEDASIGWVAQGAKAVKAAFGPDVLSGCNYSCYPYYYPHSTMYVKWFRMGAGDYGRHSEYFWQLGQVTPMINGFVSEHFRAGMRFNPKAVIKQYTMPHSPGNTDADFLRTAFTHLAHGCKTLDFFGMGMNETFTENYIDYRDTKRYVAIRDVTHSIGLVEDQMEASQVVPSKVALLISESTERWDHAKISSDDVAAGQPARDFRQDRLTFHQDRVGIYTALTFAGSSPDIVVEEDLLNPKIMKDYKVLYITGDSLPVGTVKALESWVKAGGVIYATAGVGRYGTYREPNPTMQKLVGIASRTMHERETFIRTSQELPFLKPITQVVGNGWQFPALAMEERITPVKGVQTLATFADDKSPAMIMRTIGKGKVYYMAALPGMAYLYTGLTNPIWVPDRANGVHREVTNYDKYAAQVIGMPLIAAGVRPQVVTPGYIDTRLIHGKGAFILPLANYNKPNDQPVTITVNPPAGAGTLVSVESSFCKKVPAKVENGAWVITLPKLGYGDMVRINVK